MEHLQTHDLLSNLENPSRARGGGGTCPLCGRNFTPEDKEHFRYLDKGTQDELRVCNMCYYRDPAVQRETKKRAEKRAREEAEGGAEEKAKKTAEAAEKKAKKKAEAAEKKAREDKMCVLKL